MSGVRGKPSACSGSQFALPLLYPGVLEPRYLDALTLFDRELGSLDSRDLSRLITDMLGGYHSLVLDEIGALNSKGIISDIAAWRAMKILRAGARDATSLSGRCQP